MVALSTSWQTPPAQSIDSAISPRHRCYHSPIRVSPCSAAIPARTGFSRRLESCDCARLHGGPVLRDQTDDQAQWPVRRARPGRDARQVEIPGSRRRQRRIAGQLRPGAAGRVRKARRRRQGIGDPADAQRVEHGNRTTACDAAISVLLVARQMLLRRDGDVRACGHAFSAGA